MKIFENQTGNLENASVRAIKHQEKPEVRKGNSNLRWNHWEITAFRFFFLFFLIQIIPLDWKFYRDVFSIDWTVLHYRDIFNLSRYTPRFFTDIPVFADWGMVAILAVAGTLIWTFLDRQRREYHALYYWLRVVVRYRLAMGLIAYGFLKFFPLQSPLPSLSHLNTPYGDFTEWKLFSLTLGIVPSYESFLGLVEIGSALLLLFRRTATIGTLMIIPFLGNVFISNLAYEGGEYVYSLYLVSLALFLFAFDARRLFSVFTLEQPTLPNLYQPVWTEGWQRNGRLALKVVFMLFFIGFYGYQTYQGYLTGPYHYPQQPGLAGAEGLYHVREFRLKRKTLPASAADPVRWKDVVFEKWATLSVRSNQPVQLTSTLTEEISLKEADRSYEYAGTTGRHYYHYQLDTLNRVLSLENRNPNHRGEKWQLKYSRPNGERLILSGSNAQNDSLYMVLEKAAKKYLLHEAAKEGRRKALRL
jgi:hypothetical protein